MKDKPDPKTVLRNGDSPHSDPEVASTDIFPELGDIITQEQALKLCRKYGMDYLAERLESSPGKYKDWKFDGCSCLPDKILGRITICDWKDITYKCCLPHDLGYAYGEPGNKGERNQVDSLFRYNLINKAGMSKWLAAVLLAFVRIGGHEIFGLSFSWGFAHKE